RIGKQEAERSQLDDGSHKQAELERAEARLAQLKQQLSDLRGRQVDRRLERDGLMERREKNQHRLWQESPTQHEAEALQLDLQATASRLEQIEIELLDYENRIEPLEGQVEDEQRTVSELQTELEEVRTKFAEEVKDIDAELERLRADRALQVEQVSRVLLERYERIRNRRGDPGVVKVETDICGACQTHLTSYMLRQLHSARRVQQCENCNTILYWAGELRPALSLDDVREDSDSTELFEDEE
ncbi:MAG: hypothetical protein HUU35_16620, partial [Armatimonadetes bacterium]|nr:hypothetical protein [Armatimonadota bacterium]